MYSLNSPLQLFADDCLLYRIITTKEDAIQLQHDLDQLHEWATKWQLRFNITKCTIMRFTRSLSPAKQSQLGYIKPTLLPWCYIGQQTIMVSTY